MNEDNGADSRRSMWQALRDRIVRMTGDQRVRFLAVGAGNTAFSTILFAGMVLLFGARLSPVITLCIAWVVGLVVGFALYRRLVFKVDGHFWLDFVRFASVNYMGLLINIGLLILLVEVMGLPPIPVQVAIVCIMIAFNYIGHKFFSFRRKR